MGSYANAEIFYGFAFGESENSSVIPEPEDDEGDDYDCYSHYYWLEHWTTLYAKSFGIDEIPYADEGSDPAGAKMWDEWWKQKQDLVKKSGVKIGCSGGEGWGCAYFYIVGSKVGGEWGSTTEFDPTKMVADEDWDAKLMHVAKRIGLNMEGVSFGWRLIADYG